MERPGRMVVGCLGQARDVVQMLHPEVVGDSDNALAAAAGFGLTR